jgi:hypothetical protein
MAAITTADFVQAPTSPPITTSKEAIMDALEDITFGSVPLPHPNLFLSPNLLRSQA